MFEARVGGVEPAERDVRASAGLTGRRRTTTEDEKSGAIGMRVPRSETLKTLQTARPEVNWNPEAAPML